MDTYQLADLKLNVIQGTQTDSLMLSQMLNGNGSTTLAKDTKLLEQADQNSGLEREERQIRTLAKTGQTTYAKN